MIVGIGSDLSDIRRIQKSLDRFGERFTHRVFTDGLGSNKAKWWPRTDEVRLAAAEDERTEVQAILVDEAK